MLKSFVMGAAALVMAQAAPAQHVTQPFYGLGSIGISEFTGGDADNVCRGVQECDRTGNAFKLIGGYKLTPSLAVDGRFLTSAALVGDIARLLPTLDALLDMARDNRAGPDR